MPRKFGIIEAPLPELKNQHNHLPSFSKCKINQIIKNNQSILIFQKIYMGGGCYDLREEDVMPRKFWIIEAPLPELENLTPMKISANWDTEMDKYLHI